MPGIKMCSEQFHKALDNYKATGADKDTIAAVEWAWGYMMAAMDGDYEQFATAIGYDKSVVFKMFLGKYEAGLTKIVEAIKGLRKRAIVDVGFIETPITKRIFEALDYSRDFNALVTITGETGRSKTTAVKRWQMNNNHGRSVYVRCVSAASRSSFVRTLGRAIGIGVHDKTASIEERLFKSFRRKTLIIDEAGHLIPNSSRRGTAAIEFVRDLHDIAECGICLVMTDVYLQQLRQGDRSAFFEQFLGRIGFAVDIPRKIFKAEVEAFCRAFIGGKPDADLVKTAVQIAKLEGKLRTLADDMAKARQFAQTKEEELSARHLVLARKWRQSGGSWTNLEAM